MVDARVRVTGVAAAKFNRDRLAGFQIYAAALSNIEVIEPPREPFAQAPINVAELGRYPGRRSAGHRVRVQGVVTLHWPGDQTVIQDGSGAISIKDGLPGSLVPGTKVDVAGFAEFIGTRVELRHTEARVLGTNSVPDAVPVSLSAHVTNSLLVRLSGRILGWESPDNTRLLGTVSASGRIFSVIIPSAVGARVPDLFPAGSTVLTTGILETATEGAASGNALLLRGPSDLALIRGPSNSRMPMFAAICGGAIVLAGVFFLMVSLRNRRTVTKLAEQRSLAEERCGHLDRQLTRAKEHRDRIAQELHDNIIQSIYSIGLGIDEARRIAQKDPAKLPDRLTVVIESVNAVIRDVRSFIAGIEPKGLEGHELKTALKSVLLTGGMDRQEHFAIQVDTGAARTLTSLQATELFNIAREAMYNCLRHAHAQNATVSLMHFDGGVRLEVIDDGVGFNPHSVDEKSFGLHGMKSRAEKIGARLSVVSEPGKGTRIVVDTPIASHGTH